MYSRALPINAQKPPPHVSPGLTFESVDTLIYDATVSILADLKPTFFYPYNLTSLTRTLEGSTVDGVVVAQELLGVFCGKPRWMIILLSTLWEMIKRWSWSTILGTERS